MTESYPGQTESASRRPAHSNTFLTGHAASDLAYSECGACAGDQEKNTDISADTESLAFNGRYAIKIVTYRNDT